MNADNRRLDRLREGQGELGNHIIDEFAAGRLSRRDFIRRGTVVGISLPVLGAIVSACGSSIPGGSSTGTGSSPSPIAQSASLPAAHSRFFARSRPSGPAFAITSRANAAASADTDDGCHRAT